MKITELEAYESYVELGSYAAAAKALGVDQRTIKNKVNKHLNSEEGILHRNCTDTNTPIDDVVAYWVKTDDISMYVRRPDGRLSYDDFRNMLITEISNHAPVYPKIEHIAGEHLLVVDPADIHIGKLSEVYETGEEYNMNKAVNRVVEGVTALVEKAKSHGIGKIVLVIGNDILHIDHPHRKTTAGTPQDTEGMWWQMFLEAKRCYVKIIEILTNYADVHIVFCPSNHDYTSGWMLADTIYSWFRNNPNVHFGEDQRSVSIAHRKYLVYGNNLLGFTHGDGAKEKDLPNLMQFEAREAWGQTKFAYVYVHHLHHKIRNIVKADGTSKLEKDHVGVTILQKSNTKTPDGVYVEYVRSPSPADPWHDRNGYKNIQAVEAFLHHEEYGQVARFSHFF